MKKGRQVTAGNGKNGGAEAGATGRVGPDHARRDAALEILRASVPSHAVSTRALDRTAHGPEDADAPGYRLFLAVPRAAAPVGGYPILYMLDGNAAFDALTVALLAAVPGLVIAGIGYDTEKQFARARRTLDYTPPHAPGAGLRDDPHHPGRLAGGAAAFLDGLESGLRDEVEQGLSIDPALRSLWGHSFGGLCTLYAALARPEAFARFAVISPSIWWDEPLVARLEAAARFEAAPRRMLLALGDREKRSGSDGPPPDGPAPATMAVAARLAGRPGLHLRCEVLSGCIHIATLAASLPLALPFAAEV